MWNLYTHRLFDLFREKLPRIYIHIYIYMRTRDRPLLYCTDALPIPHVIPFQLFYTTSLHSGVLTIVGVSFFVYYRSVEWKRAFSAFDAQEKERERILRLCFYVAWFLSWNFDPLLEQCYIAATGPLRFFSRLPRWLWYCTYTYIPIYVCIYRYIYLAAGVGKFSDRTFPALQCSRCVSVMCFDFTRKLYFSSCRAERRGFLLSRIILSRG